MQIMVANGGIRQWLIDALQMRELPLDFTPDLHRRRSLITQAFNVQRPTLNFEA
jgi:hypothetical protein